MIPASLRPVALTSCPRKLVEGIVARRIRGTVEAQLPPQQAGFRPGRSTLDPLARLFAWTISPWQAGEGRCGASGSRWAFGSVDRGRILHALRAHKVAPCMSRWEANFLSLPRGQKPRVQNTPTAPVHFTRGVPQGCVLGPPPPTVAANSLGEKPVCIPNLELAFIADDLTATTERGRGAMERTLRQALRCTRRWVERNKYGAQRR
ncbi:Tcoingi protein [Trypanosoma conorhini]|uniref:Tcoingi protein n=1 Tax=Trypanosoma conorhini TaxID=83891 RepID=A0A422MUV5_9TRYP|nr:Tcoingi protein [Trypanosoma conorhini]RNE96976.1 Tcoingi protein [Trypanosoma conorhini]